MEKEFDLKNLKALINNTSDLMWSVDNNLKLITSNKPFDDMVQLMVGEKIRKGDDILLKRLNEEIISHWKNLYRRALSGESFVTLEERKAPYDFVWEISFYPIYDEGIIIGAACFSHDVTESKRAKEKLEQSEAQVRNFAKHLHNMQEEERSRIAGEIHDELEQQLLGLKLGLSSLKNFNGEKNVLVEKVNDMLKNIDTCIQSLRQVVIDLRPSILDTLGLIASIEWLATSFKKKTNIECLLQLNVKEQPFDKHLSICFFRICQEALTNIAKHSRATKVVIQMFQNGKQLTLNISDNGIGIGNAELENPFSLGIIGMRERAGMINARFEINSVKGKGTFIQVDGFTG